MSNKRAYLRRPIELLLSTLCLFLVVGRVVKAQTDDSKYESDSLGRTAIAAKPANGAGVMVSGELWDSFLPQGVGVSYVEVSYPIVRIFTRMGNFDRLWSHPTHIWPGGYNLTAFWTKKFLMTEYNPDPTFNPQYVDGSQNPSYDPDSGPNYALAAYAPNPASPGRTIPGAGDPSRDYSIETQWADSKRHYAVYEAGWPTNLGIDVKMKVHQWSLNWNNFNDFIIVEFQLTNTGNVDIDCDGTAERTDNVIQALTLYSGGEVAMSALVNTAGTRSSHWGAGRHSGYIGDLDSKGAPWDFIAVYPGESSPGLGNFGLNSTRLKYYTDIWSAWTWLGVKQGTSPTGSDKQTIFGTHPIGQGAQRGWYTSAGDGVGLGIRHTSPRSVHVASMGTWYAEGGKMRDKSRFDLAPNSNFFQSGTAGNPTTFVPRASPARPNGDRKMLSDETGAAAFEVSKFEDAWTKGYNSQQNFDGDVYSGIGPFRMEVGETITIYWVESGGYRLQGVANAIAAARWTFQNALAVPAPPPTPHMRVIKPLDTPMRIYWDSRAESDTGFAGYKIYGTSSVDSIDWLEGGMRGLDEYWRTTVPGATPPAHLTPVNPNFSAYSSVEGVRGIPDTWGPYELVKVIPAGEKVQYADDSLAGYDYSWGDEGAELGPSYWYYVSAYAEGDYDLGSSWVSFQGTNPATADTIESSNINRNGASGLWENTYPFAYRNPFYPLDPEGLQRIGAPVQRDPLLAYDQVSFGSVSVGASSDRSVILTNSADDAVNISIATSNALFVPMQNQVLLGPGGSFEITCRYTPSSVNSDTGMILFTWNGIPYADTIQVTGSGSGSGYYAFPSWDAIGSLTSEYYSFELGCDQSGNVYSAGVRSYPRPSYLDVEKRSPSGFVYWRVSEEVFGSLPRVAGMHISGANEAFVLVADHPPQIYKFNSSGLRQWKWEHSVEGYLCVANDMAVDTAGNIYVTGYIRWTNYNLRIFVAKINPQGQEEWSSFFDFQDNPQDSTDAGMAIAVDPGGNVGVVGRSALYPDQNIVVMRCDQNGVIDWHYVIEASVGAYYYGRDIAMDTQGNVYVAGSERILSGEENAFLICYESDGTFSWGKAYPEDLKSFSSGYRLVLDGEDGIYAVGSWRSDLLEHPDYLTLRYDLSGNLQWARTYDGPVSAGDGGKLIELDDQKNVYVTGTSMGSTGDNEMATLKYSGSTGETIWEARYDGPSGLTTTALTIDPSRNVLVGGYSQGAAGRTVIVKYGQLATSVREVGDGVPSAWSLDQNYPNPFNPSTTIQFALPQLEYVTLTVYDVLGREVAVLVDGKHAAGTYNASWDASGQASGVYFYRLSAGNYVQIRKMLLLR
jgi:hypothetical protein